MGTVEFADRLGEQAARHRSQVVETDRTLDQHSVRRADLDLCFDPANSPGDEGDDDVS